MTFHSAGSSLEDDPLANCVNMLETPVFEDTYRETLKKLEKLANQL